MSLLSMIMEQTEKTRLQSAYDESDKPSNGWRAPDGAEPKEPELPGAEPSAEELLESPQPAALRDLSLIFAGNAIFTIRSKSTGSRFTYRVKYAEAFQSYKPKYFVGVLTGTDNTNDYAYLGIITEDRQRFFHDRKHRISEDAPSALAWRWFFQKLTEGRTDVILRQAEIFHEGRCCRCGRVLTTPESVQAGIGPVCEGR